MGQKEKKKKKDVCKCFVASTALPARKNDFGTSSNEFILTLNAMETCEPGRGVDREQHIQKARPGTRGGGGKKRMCG